MRLTAAVLMSVLIAILGLWAPAAGGARADIITQLPITSFGHGTGGQGAIGEFDLAAAELALSAWEVVSDAPKTGTLQVTQPEPRHTARPQGAEHEYI